MSSDAPGSGRERVLYLLKTKGPQTTARMAERLGVTTMAVRQHLAVLQGEELVEYVNERRKFGRPARVWQLTRKAFDRFPNHHAELAVGLLEAVRNTFGEKGLKRLTKEWTRKQTESYRSQMPGPKAPLEQRVATLTRLRREEGYMAECGRRRDGALELVENHCSIAQAARLCSNLCDGELSLFRAVLGEDLSIDRVEHILSGDRCCTYCITDHSGDSPSGGTQ
jgi:predicted ArsR family transcriptional regulator